MATRRQSRRTIDAASLEIEIARLGDLDLKALRLRWQSVTGRSAPVHLPKHLLFAKLACRTHAAPFGDLDAGMVQMLRAAVGSGRWAPIPKLTDKVDQRNQAL